MRAIIALSLTLLFSVTAFGGHRRSKKVKTPIADAILLEQVIEVEAEVMDFSHKARALKSSYRILLYTTFNANNGFCPVAIFQDPSDQDLLDVLETIRTGITNNVQSFRQSKKIHRKLGRVLRKLEKRRVIDAPDVAELVIGNGISVDYGTIPVFTTSMETIVITNSGAQPAVISAVTVSGSDFFISSTGSTCAAGVTVAAGESCTIDMIVTPLGSGTISADLMVDYNNSQADTRAIVPVTAAVN